MPIQLLPPRLANQIAAGEVVERPASVVKELIENSLDAGATRIELDIERGGHKRIRLRDNGGGIAKNELQLALSRHATSKIATLDDLEQILSLGFRGEALASISSVSRLSLTSKTPEQSEAWQASCEGREMDVSIVPAAHPDGTTIDVADLFYNTPARRKFLRTEKTEYQHIEDVVKRIALSHPQVSFTLKHNNKVMRRFAAVKPENQAQRLAQVVGQKFVDNATTLMLEHQGMKIQAWLGNHTMLRSSNDCQFSFVNYRGMRDKLILHAIRQAYEMSYGAVEQPAFVFYLNVDPKEVDVNVHPAKHEVRFQQSRLVHDFICKAVYDALCEDVGSGAAVSTNIDASVTHDYIRPLARQHTDVAERQPAGAQYAPVASGTHSAGGSPASQRERRSSSYSPDYQASFNQLMTPKSDTQSAEALSPKGLQLNLSYRLVHDESTVILLGATDLLPEWWRHVLDHGRTSQPLLMPVAVDADNICAPTISRLNEIGFVINNVAGKLRLQQVPAGCRHLPWVSLFPQLVSLRADSIEALARQLSELDIDWPDDVIAHIWQWFDNLPLSQQNDISRSLGTGVDSTQLIDKWGMFNE
ncbi:DNA mismatch repair endonuclease MutL [Salinimonas sp. HHU 13199]|uniref:DNA mismatch repair protein MutL n=1 Tax=Salinimonas profundi TaxID=2729140 RepID=A0ABR8LLD4_9ALTE|nr:DNA mismatch repair endonuclease MutL [Salinimonas profundi]MBD3586358.1 DNA mismatch repair endonuclease MutL [Salinimonas profundi]